MGLPSRLTPPPVGLTKESIEQILGRVIPDILITIAKNDVLGVEPEVVAQILGSTTAEVLEIQETQDYKDVRLVIGTKHAESKAEADLSWDALEGIALKRLLERAHRETDMDTLLRLAAVSNKAVRRAPATNNVLDPANARTHVPITLSRKFVETINLDGSVQRSESQSIQLPQVPQHINPTFADIDALLKISEDMGVEGPKFRPGPVRGEDDSFDESF